MAKAAQTWVRENLTPADIFCYHIKLFHVSKKTHTVHFLVCYHIKLFHVSKKHILFTFYFVTILSCFM